MHISMGLFHMSRFLLLSSFSNLQLDFLLSFLFSLTRILVEGSTTLSVKFCWSFTIFLFLVLQTLCFLQILFLLLFLCPNPNSPIKAVFVFLNYYLLKITFMVIFKAYSILLGNNFLNKKLPDKCKYFVAFF